MDGDHADRSDVGELEAEADERSADSPSEARDDEPAAPESGSRLPIDQQALNVIGLAQAREELRAARRRREQSDDPPSTDDDELQASVDRHPSGRARRKPPRPSQDEPPDS